MYSIQIHPGRVVLQHPQHYAEIYPHGALLNAYAIRLADGSWFNTICGYVTPAAAACNLTAGFHSAKLSPFACRIRHSEYTFDGQTYRTGKFYAAGHAAHGLLYDAPFQTTAGGSDDKQAWLELSHDYPGNQPGYPFPYRLSIRYTLSADGISLTTTARNTGTSALPLADGWHPYFTLGGCADDWQLTVNSSTRLAFDQDLVPDGRHLEDTRFIRPHLLAGIELDNSFLLSPQPAPACRLENQRLQLDILPDSSYPVLQIYLPPERQSIAIENLSGAPDCFNNHIGLLRLAAGESREFYTRYCLSEKSFRLINGGNKYENACLKTSLRVLRS